MATSARLQKFYIAYYGRAADVTGLDYWLGVTGTEANLVTNFGSTSQTEFTNLYGSNPSTASFVNAVFNNLFGHAADAEGLQYWIGVFNDKVAAGQSANAVRADMVMWILDGAQTADAAVVAAKLTAAQAWTAALNTTSEIVAYDDVNNTAAQATARNWLAAVTSSATATSQSADPLTRALESVVNDYVGATGSGYTLTSGSDVPGNTSLADTFTATAGQLNSTDVINGAAGTDTLTVTMGNGVTVKPTLSNVEIINSLGSTTAASTIDLGSSSGVTKINLSDAAVGITATNVGAVVSSKLTNTAATLSVAYTAAALSGSSDNMTLTLNNVSTATFNVSSASATADLETVTVNSIGGTTNTVQLLTNDADVTTVVVTGDTAVNLQTLASEVTTVNAAASTGVTLLMGAAGTVTGGSGADDVTLASGDNSVVAGGGNDSIRFAAGGFGTGDVVNGGAGTDTIYLAASAQTLAATDLTGLSAVEVIDVANTTQAFKVTLTDTQVANNNNIAIKASAYADDAATLTVDASAVSASYSVTVDLGALSGGNTLGVATAITLGSGADTLKIDVEDISDAIGVNAGTGLDTINLLDGNGGTKVTLGTGFTNFEKMTFATATETYNVATRDLSVASGVTFVVDASNLTTGVLKFDGSLEGADATSLGSFSILGGSGADTITGGAGADYINAANGANTVDGGSGADTIVTGTGADSIIGGLDYDNISAGAGNDTITGLTSYASGTGVDTIDGGAGTDTLLIAAADTTIVAADLTGLSNIEILEIAATTHDVSLTLNDAAAAALNGATIKLNAGESDAATVNVAATTLGASYGVTIDMSDLSAGVTIAATSQILLGSGADTLKIDAEDLSDTFLFNASAGTDTIQVMDANGGTQVTLGTGFQGFDKMTFATATATYNLVGVEGTVASGVTFVVDGSNLTTGVLKFSTTETDGYYSIVGGSGADTITGGALADYINAANGANTVDGGSGADTIVTGTGADSIVGGAGYDNIDAGAGNDTIDGLSLYSTAYGVDTINGGAGTDTLVLSSGSFVSYDITGISNIEAITLGAATYGMDLTLTDAFMANNGNAITVNVKAGESTTATVNVSAAVSSSYAVTLDMGDLSAGVTLAATSVFTLGAGADTLKIDLEDLADTFYVTGGAGTDTINLMDANGGTDVTVGTGFANFEKLTFATASSTYKVTTVDGTVASGVTFVVDASTFTTGAISFTGSAESNGYFSVVSGSGNDTITGGALADNISAGAGNDSLVGGSGVDTLSGGVGNDTITGGAGADSITLGSGNDLVIYTAVAESSSTNVDTITDWLSADDTLQIAMSFSGMSSAININAGTVGSAAGLTASEALLSGKYGEFVYDTTNAKLWVNLNDDNDLTTTDYSININAATTAANTIIDGDINFSITGGAGADTIVAGSGNDTIIGGSGADTITGGAGTDTYYYGTGDSLSGTLDVIYYGSGVDIIDFAGAATLASAESDGATATSDVDINGSGLVTFAADDDTFGEMVTALQADSALDAAGKVALFTLGSDAYIYYAGAATGNADDQIIKLIGNSGLTTITLSSGNLVVS